MEPASAGTILAHTEDAPVEVCELAWWCEGPAGKDDVLEPPVGLVISGWRAPARVVVAEEDDEADIELIESRRGEPCLSHDEVKARLRADGLLPD